MATCALNNGYQPLKVTKPRSLPKISTMPKKLDSAAINQLSYILKTTQETLISPVYSGVSFTSSNTPLYSAMAPQLTKNNVNFFSHTAPKSSSEGKYQRLSLWLDKSDTEKVDTLTVDYLSEFSLFVDDKDTRQHVENISYVIDVESFTEQIYAYDDELEVGDDCESFHYKKTVSSSAIEDDCLFDSGLDLDFDPRFFEEAVQSPPSENNENDPIYDDYVIDCLPEAAANFAMIFQ